MEPPTVPDAAHAQPAARAATPRVLAVDGNSLGHRAFHSSRADASADVPVVTGTVVSMLATVWVHGPYDAVVMAFDHPVNRRRGEHVEYKATRKATPAELTAALIDLRLHLEACGLAVEEQEGAEADDLLASVVDSCAAHGWPCDVLSSDRDLTALVGDGVRLLRPQARFSDLLVEDEAAVRRRYGVAPHQYVDLAALRGDPSDGLAGVTGIGPKTAARLLRDHGSVANIYAHLHELDPRVEAALRAGRERVERNLLLMAPIPHLQVEVAAAAAAGLDPERITAVLDGLGLEVAARRLRRALTAPPAPPTPPPPDEAADGGQPLASPTRRPVPAVVEAQQVGLF